MRIWVGLLVVCGCSSSSTTNIYVGGRDDAAVREAAAPEAGAVAREAAVDAGRDAEAAAPEAAVDSGADAPVDAGPAPCLEDTVPQCVCTHDAEQDETCRASAPDGGPIYYYRCSQSVERPEQCATVNSTGGGEATALCCQ